jgi:hypothetical protein
MQTSKGKLVILGNRILYLISQIKIKVSVLYNYQNKTHLFLCIWNCFCFECNAHHVLQKELGKIIFILKTKKNVDIPLILNPYIHQGLSNRPTIMPI